MKNKEMTREKDRFDPRTLTAILILSIVEYEVFTFSKSTVATAKQDAWLSVILGAIIGTVIVYLFIKLAARFPGRSYFEYLKIVWGRPLGLLFSALYFLYFLAFLGSLFYETTMANTLLFLPSTPRIVPLLIFSFSLVWLISYGIAPLVRFFQLFLPFMILPLLFLAILFCASINLENYQPFLGEGFVPVLKGAFYFLGAYQGPEVLLFLAPFIHQINKATKPAILGYAVPAFIGWTNTTAALGILGVQGIKESVMPGINVVTIIQLPGFPVERFGLLLTLPWLIAIFTTLAIYLYLFCYGFIEEFNLKDRKRAIYIFTAIPLLFGYLLPNAVWHEQLRTCLTLATPFIVYALPVLTLCLAAIRRKSEVKE